MMTKATDMPGSETCEQCPRAHAETNRVFKYNIYATDENPFAVIDFGSTTVGMLFFRE